MKKILYNTGLSFTPDVGAGISPDINIQGDETEGVINISTGSSPSTGTICSVALTDYLSTDNIYVKIKSLNGEANDVYADVTGYDNFNLTAITALTGSHAYSFHYEVIVIRPVEIVEELPAEPELEKLYIKAGVAYKYGRPGDRQ